MGPLKRSEVITAIILATGIRIENVAGVWKGLFHFNEEASHSISAF
jgi:hypothetical protein